MSDTLDLTSLVALLKQTDGKTEKQYSVVGGIFSSLLWRFLRIPQFASTFVVATCFKVNFSVLLHEYSGMGGLHIGDGCICVAVRVIAMMEM